MKILFLIFTLSVFNFSFAQVVTKEIERGPVEFTPKTEDSDSQTEISQIKGVLLTSNGEDFRESFISKYEFPDDASDNGISGLLVIDFVIENNGYASDIKVIKSLCETCDAEAIRIIKSTKFKACEVDGIPSRCRYRFPIRLALE